MERKIDHYLARAAWLLADIREHLRTLPGSKAEALVERCDDYFSETYSWLKSQTMSALATCPSPSPAQSVEYSGVEWKAPPQGPTLNGPASPDIATSTPPSTSSVALSSAPTSGGKGGKKLSVDFF